CWQEWLRWHGALLRFEIRRSGLHQLTGQRGRRDRRSRQCDLSWHPADADVGVPGRCFEAARRIQRRILGAVCARVHSSRTRPAAGGHRRAGGLPRHCRERDGPGNQRRRRNRAPLRSNSIALRTERLWLRPCASRDLDRVHELWTSQEIREFLFDGRRISRGETQSIIDTSTRCFAERGYGIWLFFAADEEEQPGLIAGFVGLLHESPESPRLVFGTRPTLRGRAYAVEASLAVLRHAFGALGLPRVFADVDEPNRASR